jgi:TetR/AcrR family transcriptional repressor of nem operon
MKRKAAEALKEMLASLEYIIQKGIDQGEFDATLDAKKEAMFIFGLIEGGIMMSKVSDNPAILNSLLDNLKEQVMQRYQK